MSRTVLNVEDNERNLKLVRDVLGFAGFECLAARDAEAGIELARARRPDVVLMDINLPGMTGFEALAALRADDAAHAATRDTQAEALIRAYRARGLACESCGPRPESDAIYCSQCGRYLAGACGSCGSPVTEAGARYCGACGGALAA